MSYPRIIFLDAVGTLFAIQGTVGRTYAQFAAEYGVEVSESHLSQSFSQAFRAAPAFAFSLVTSQAELESLEKQWWCRVVMATFGGVLPQDNLFSGFDEFFDRVYDHFSTAAAWSLYPEVMSTLENWSNQGIQLGVISNFDTRLLKVLEALELDHFFQSITLSSHAGAAKPDARIFQVALDQCEAKAEEAIHVGDQHLDDYQGALGAGLRGVWLNRERQGDIKVPKNNMIESLDQLCLDK